jgi:hypothetical protein
VAQLVDDDGRFQANDLLGQAAARMLAELLRVQRLLQGAGAEPAARSGER